MDRGVHHRNLPLTPIDHERKEEDETRQSGLEIRTDCSVEKKKARERRGLPDPKIEPTNVFNDNFIQRPVLRIPGVNVCLDSSRATIMTYNLLAQSLIRRRLFPFSGTRCPAHVNAKGDTLKWKNRSRMLTKELTYYHPTVLCMQEVDLEQYEPYFVKLLDSLDYDHIKLAAKRKRQGLIIAWKRAAYKLIHRKDIYYDLLSVGSVGPTMWTGNIALCVGLKALTTSTGLWISNTHLFWHPRGSYERQRQAGLLVSETLKYAAAEPTWRILICGGNVPSLLC